MPCSPGGSLEASGGSAAKSRLPPVWRQHQEGDAAADPFRMRHDQEEHARAARLLLFMFEVTRQYAASAITSQATRKKKALAAVKTSVRLSSSRL